MSLLKEIQSHPTYQQLYKTAEQNTPPLPIWQIDEITGKDNVEEWKKKSAMREGFELCLAYFQPK